MHLPMRRLLCYYEMPTFLCIQSELVHYFLLEIHLYGIPACLVTASYARLQDNVKNPDCYLHLFTGLPVSIGVFSNVIWLYCMT